MKRIILATGNQGKVRELKEILGSQDIQVLSLRDFRISGRLSRMALHLRKMP